MSTYTVSKTRLKFPNSKIAYKNTLNKFFVFFSKKYYYAKKQKLKKKNLNLDRFEEVMSEKPKFDIF